MREKKSPKKHTFLRVTAAILVVVALVFLLVCLGLFLWAGKNIDVQTDEALFSAAGESSLTRLYYDGEGGEAVEGLPSYRAVEWQEESFSGSARSLRVSYEDLPPYLPLAFVAIEDKRFFDHDGVDWKRTISAFANEFLHFSARKINAIVIDALHQMGIDAVFEAFDLLPNAC